jgi:hypothetical protein
MYRRLLRSLAGFITTLVAFSWLICTFDTTGANATQAVGIQAITTGKIMFENFMSLLIVAIDKFCNVLCINE